MLFKGPLLPTPDMNMTEKLNCMTKIAFIIAGGLYFYKYSEWAYFLLLALLIILALQYSSTKKKSLPSDGDETSATTSIEDSRSVEEFAIVPTYTGADYSTITIPPLFAEEWQVGAPPAYDLYTNVPYVNDDGSFGDRFDEPLKPQEYRYGQYLTRTNLLPSDEYYTHLSTGTKAAREYANSAFLRHDIARADNMTRIMKKKIARRFRHDNLNDSFSPFHSF